MGMHRRYWVLAGSAALAGLAFDRLARGAPGVEPGFAPLARRTAAAADGTAGRFELEHSDAQWRQLLTPEQYAVLRKEGTERAFTSPLNHEKRKGLFACAGCQLALFSSASKFDSGTGWPSFWEPLDHAVATTQDATFGMTRTAVHCRRCGGHLGHVFDDGPPPTGLRYCMNGVALIFKPDEGQS
jgi:peptide-methionine (R)-S-oxide reductase